MTASDEPKPAASLGKSSLIMASGTAVSRALGLIRNILLVAAVGATGAVADAYDIANKIPNILFTIIAGGVLNAVIVPQVIKAYKSKNAQDHLNKLITLTATILLVITTILTLGATVLVGIYINSSWPPELVALAVSFAFWCIPQLFFYGLYSLLGQILNARSQFGPFMWSPALNNVISIIGFGIYLMIYGPIAVGKSFDPSQWDGTRIAIIGLTATLGVAAQALVLLVPLYRSGFRWHLKFGYRGIGLRSSGIVGLWLLASVLLDQVAVWFTTRIATGAPHAAELDGIAAGSVAGNGAYSQALMVYLLPHSLVTVSICTALFTGMTAAANAGQIDRVRAIVSNGLRTIAVFTVFATASFFVLAQPLMKLLVPTLTPAGVDSVSKVLAAMTLGLVPLGAMVLMKWVYFAFEDGKTVFLIQIPVTIVYILGSYAASLLLPGKLWVMGIGLALSLSNFVTVGLRLKGLALRLKGLDLGHIINVHVRLTVAAIISGVLGYLLLRILNFSAEDSWFTALWTCAVISLVMLGIYFLLLRVMHVRELKNLLDPILKKLKRT